ncbi:putative circadian clock protein, KaiC [Thermodesulfatator indicus DSM 15286]|uniref:Circadian clock protein, KaiC n=1 Tax=Thermodesulfatator indicus (strain DSM 15286 / JCM 11887 / CIR29812) TaxID=667014 RepID=F8AE01_THEID|nr:KaiC domain-containing protein [Thermodesulfatator indicus]AEH44968.1 putative circadian clock protein, KaiC [Thermodesulfatator indicus DSM 15286]
MDERERHIVYDAIYKVSDAQKKAPKLVGVPTGVKGLDELFYTVEWKEGKPVRKPLGGIPLGCVVNLTGMPDTGKSLMAEQFTIKQASLGEPVCFVTVETPASYLSVGLEQRAKAMGVDFKEIEDKIIILDAASYSRLREDMPTLLDTLAHIYRTYKVHRTVIDSITGLYEAREMLARSVVRALYTFCKKWYQTALFISQKRSSHEELSAEAAGGYAVGHIVDSTMVLSKELILSARAAQLYKVDIGEIVRLFRIDGCRMCGHDTKVHLMDITELGLVEIGPPLVEVLRARGGSK